MKRQQKKRAPARVQPVLHTWQSSVSDIIRSAEKFLSEGRYDVALEQLNQARGLDPANQYIDAIIVRAQNLRATQINPGQGRDPALEGSESSQPRRGVRSRFACKYASLQTRRRCC